MSNYGKALLSNAIALAGFMANYGLSIYYAICEEHSYEKVGVEMGSFVYLLLNPSAS